MKSILYILIFIILYSCSEPSGEERMLLLLKEKQKAYVHHLNPFSAEGKLLHIDSLLHHKTGSDQVMIQLTLEKAEALLQLGRTNEAIGCLETLLKDEKIKDQYFISKLHEKLAISYLRMGEQTNCISNHTTESCIFPVQGGGIHIDQNGSRKAVGLYEGLLMKNNSDLESRWLLNIAYMTLGEYPSMVPQQWLIPNLSSDSSQNIRPFEDIAPSLRLDTRNMAGGVIAEDFNNDGYLDIVNTGWDLEDEMHYFINNADGSFTDLSKSSGLSRFTGGLNCMQTDYNNDGFMDIFVTRGGWTLEFGTQPNSLLKNNGDNTFTDVTIEAGLLSFHPTQTATWNDFNNDGWIDLFIGNETSGLDNSKPVDHPCELYINDRKGAFKEVAKAAGCDVKKFVKGVSSGDYNKDGWKDIFLSTLDGEKILLKNEGEKDGVMHFAKVSKEAKLDSEKNRTFITWFWDFDNDGWLDILCGDYTFQNSRGLGYYAASYYLNSDPENIGHTSLFRNNKDGTFTNISKEAGLYKPAFSMGSNFGDMDNDGYLDIYLGTGNPSYKSLVPNKMFRSVEGKTFEDVTNSARVGSLQKGHGVAFCDMDNDGDQDIFTDLGGAFIGDAYHSAFYLNPGQNKNNWICLRLEGSSSNRSAIGSLLKITFVENGKERNVYREVNSGGSFGASTLRKEIGIGSATVIDKLEIQWHGSGKTEIFKNITPNQFIKIKEGEGKVQKLSLKSILFKKASAGTDHSDHSMH